MIPIAVNTQTSSLFLDPLAPLLCIAPLRKVMVPVECESTQPFVRILVRMRHKIVGSLRIVEIR